MQLRQLQQREHRETTAAAGEKEPHCAWKRQGMLLEEIAFELGLEGWAAMFKRRMQGKGIPALSHERKWPKSKQCPKGKKE